MMKLIPTVAALMAFLCGPGPAMADAPPDPASDGKVAAIERVIQGEMAARGIPGVQLTILQGDRVVLSGAYGQADPGDGTPVTAKTVFGVNSISKAFTGVAAMQLVEAGRLDLDAPLTRYLNALPASWSEISVRQVLTHTSGLPEIVDDNLRPIDGAEPELAWRKVRELPLDFVPGTRFDYTQTNYVVMGKIIEAITGESFAAFVRQRQFDAAGMTRTGFSGAAPTGAPIAALYTHLTLLTEGTRTVGVQRSKVPFHRHEPMPDYLYPAGGVQTTSADLARWVVALRQQKLLGQASYAQLWKPQVLKDGTYRGFTSTINGYGLGWPSMRRAAHPAIALIGGERAAVLIYPEDDLAVIVLTNLLGASPQKFIDKIASVYLPDLAEPGKSPAPGSVAAGR